MYIVQMQHWCKLSTQALLAATANSDQMVIRQRRVLIVTIIRRGWEKYQLFVDAEGRDLQATPHEESNNCFIIQFIICEILIQPTPVIILFSADSRAHYWWSDNRYKHRCKYYEELKSTLGQLHRLCGFCCGFRYLGQCFQILSIFLYCLGFVLEDYVR